jgi:hypothetical protein
VDAAGHQYLPREAGWKIVRARLAGAIWALMVLGLQAGCATTSPDGSFPAQKALLGKTGQEVLACAGEPKKKSMSGEETLLTYHRTAPVFEESFAGSKSSVPCPRHACEAVVVLKGDRVTEVRYHPKPYSLGGCEHCEEIFQMCLP